MDSETIAGQQRTPEFFHKTWHMWVCLAFLPPIGLVLLWFHHGYHKAVKVLLSVFFGFWSFIFIMAMIPESEQARQDRFERQEIRQSATALTTRATTTPKATTAKASTTPKVTTTKATTTHKATTTKPTTAKATTTPKTTTTRATTTKATATTMGTKSPAVAREEYINSAETISYEQLVREPYLYEGKTLAVTFKVAQTLAGGFLKEAGYRGYESGYDNEWYAQYKIPNETPRILDGDTVTFYGEFVGLTEMTRGLTGVKVYVPKLNVMYHEILP